MIVKCLDCNQPMTETTKNKPKDIPKQNKWILCRECNKGVEVVGSVDGKPVQVKGNKVDEISYTETSTIYVVISHEGDRVIKTKYADIEHKSKISEDVLN